MVLDILQTALISVVLSAPHKDGRLRDLKRLVQVPQWLARLPLSFFQHLKDKSLHHSPFAYRIEAKFLTGRQGAMLSFQPYLPLGSSLTPLFQTGMSVPSPPTHNLTPHTPVIHPLFPQLRMSYFLLCAYSSPVHSSLSLRVLLSWNASGPTSLTSPWFLLFRPAPREGGQIIHPGQLTLGLHTWQAPELNILTL